jgi:chemotaxis protein methyltransferase CheR
VTPEDMDLLAALARQRAGLRIESDKAYLVESRLNPLARREGFDSIEAMIAALRAHREERLIWAVVEALTLNETAFFRDREVFAHLRDELLPACRSWVATVRSGSGAPPARPARRSIPWP